MEIYTPVHVDCMCYVSGCDLHVNGLFGQNSEIDAEWFENNWDWLQYREDAFYVHVNVFRQLGEEEECFWN